MKHVSTYNDLEKYSRNHLFNSFSGPKSAMLIGTESEDGKSNLALFSSVFHIGANPALLGFISRPHTVERHTLENINATKQYTMNLITRPMIDNAHQTSAKYPKDTSEFDAVGFEKMYHTDFKAPFVAESPLKIGLELSSTSLIKENGCILVIGAITYLDFPDDAVAEDGSLRLDTLDAVSIGSLTSYYSLSFVKSKGFARP